MNLFPSLSPFLLFLSFCVKETSSKSEVAESQKLFRSVLTQSSKNWFNYAEKILQECYTRRLMPVSKNSFAQIFGGLCEAVVQLYGSMFALSNKIDWSNKPLLRREKLCDTNFISCVKEMAGKMKSKLSEVNQIETQFLVRRPTGTVSFTFAVENYGLLGYVKNGLYFVVDLKLGLNLTFQKIHIGHMHLYKDFIGNVQVTSKNIDTKYCGIHSSLTIYASHKTTNMSFFCLSQVHYELVFSFTIMDFHSIVSYSQKQPVFKPQWTLIFPSNKTALVRFHLLGPKYETLLLHQNLLELKSRVHDGPGDLHLAPAVMDAKTKYLIRWCQKHGSNTTVHRQHHNLD